MTARLSIHVPDEAVHESELGTAAEFVLGRDPQCDLVVSHHSISRRHLRLWRDATGQWSVQDLGSKNGTRMDGRLLGTAQAIAAGTWFAAGDVYMRFDETDAAVEVSRRAAADRRRHSSMIWNTRLRHGTQAHKLIGDLLRGVVETADARRGFLLVIDRFGDWRVRACYAIETDELAGNAFSGSRSAVDRAIGARRPVYLSDQRDKVWLQAQDSIMSGGIRTLLAIPLIQDDKVLGVVYADTDDAERVYTDLDAQLLDALVAHAGNVISALELEASLAEVSALLKVSSDGLSAEPGPAPHWAAQGAKA